MYLLCHTRPGCVTNGYPRPEIGREPQQIAEGMADVLMSALRRTRSMYASITWQKLRVRFLVLKIAQHSQNGWKVRRPRLELARRFSKLSFRRAKVPSIAATSIGMDAEGGLVAAGDSAQNFPRNGRSPLSVAANQALISVLKCPRTQ